MKTCIEIEMVTQTPTDERVAMTEYVRQLFEDGLHHCVLHLIEEFCYGDDDRDLADRIRESMKTFEEDHGDFPEHLIKGGFKEWGVSSLSVRSKKTTSSDALAALEEVSATISRDTTDISPSDGLIIANALQRCRERIGG